MPTMSLQSQIELCSKNYEKWKESALSSDGGEQRKAAERAFFWLELQAAFTFLWALEQTHGNDPEVKKKLIVAKSNLTKKLAEYADKIWKEITVK